MKILFIAEPSSSQTKKWLRVLGEAGHEIYFISYHNRLKTTIKNVTEIAHFRFVNKNPLVFIEHVINLKKIIKITKPDILTCHYALGTPGLIASLSGFHPLVVTVLGGIDLYGQKLNVFRDVLYKNLVFGRVFKPADSIIVGCQDHKDYLVRNGINKDKIHVIFGPGGLGIDFNLFNNNFDPGPLREELELRDKFVIFCPRRIVPYTNIDVLIRSIGILKTKIPDISLILLKYAASEKYLTYITGLINKSGVGDNVIFLNEQKNDDMPKLFRASDLVISISSFDGTPLSIAEAMACQRPTISYSIPSIKEFVENGRTGIIIQNLNPDELSEAVLKLYSDKELSGKIRENALNFIKEHAGIEKSKEKLKSIYQELYEHNRRT